MSAVNSITPSVVSWALDNDFKDWNPTDLINNKSQVLEAYNLAHEKSSGRRKNNKKMVCPIVHFKDGSHEDIVLAEVPFRKKDVAMVVYAYVMTNHESLGMTFDRESMNNIEVRYSVVDSLGGLLGLVD